MGLLRFKRHIHDQDRVINYLIKPYLFVELTADFIEFYKELLESCLTDVFLSVIESRVKPVSHRLPSKIDWRKKR